MKMKKTFGVMMFSIVGVVATSIAQAQTANLPIESTGVEIGGQSCTSFSPGMTPVHNQFGIYNPSTTSGMYITCPVVMPQHRYITLEASVIVYNRNSADPVYCVLGATDFKGENLIYDTKRAAVAQSAYVELDPQISPNVGLPFPVNSIPTLTCYLPPTTYDNSYFTSAEISGWYYQDH